MSKENIFVEMKDVEKSLAESVDKLSYVNRDKIQQFTDLTYTEIANFSYLLHRANRLKNVKTPWGKTIVVHESESPIEETIRNYMELKVSMNRASRSEVRNVAQSFGGAIAEERRGLLSKIRGWLRI
ncbi:MAG: hypothetical protein H5T50_03840 [Nitrososphaeria archaeon]|nr:hypothetical protein [Nitrososphaeria archaeon]